MTSYYRFTLSCANLPPDLGPGCLFFFLKTQHISTGSLFVLCGHLGMAQLAPFIFTTSVHTSLLCSKGLSRKLNGQMLNQLENATKGKKNSTFHNFLWKCIMLYTSYSAIILKVLQLLTNSRQGLKNVKSRNIFNGKLKPDCKEAKGNSQIKGAV